MKCPTCNVWTRVLESRNDYRKRECANLHIFWTHEASVKESEYKKAMAAVYHQSYMRRKLKG